MPRLIAEELNVKRVEFTEKADHYISYSVLPDLKRLGPRLGKRLPALGQALAQADAGQILAALSAEGKVTLALPDGLILLEAECSLQVRMNAKEGWAAARGRSSVVVVSTDLTPELLSEGLAREVVHAIQTCRKDMNCQYTDRIRLALVTASPELHAAVSATRPTSRRRRWRSIYVACCCRKRRSRPSGPKPCRPTRQTASPVPPPVNPRSPATRRCYASAWSGEIARFFAGWAPSAASWWVVPTLHDMAYMIWLARP